MRQELVQTCGTITNFNYAYCSILYEKLYWLLRSDIIDANGNQFVIFGIEAGDWVRRYQNRLDVTQKALDKYNPNDDEENVRNDYQKNLNISHIIIKDESLLPVIIEHLEEQTKIKSRIFFASNGYIELEELRKFINEVNLFFGQVKEFLEMFG
ncbi:MAG: hypothetical protein WCK59_02165 [Candidatus Falkowbacteria bacterium]